MLRSLNADPLDPPNATPNERLVSVVYPGPAVAGALVFWRVALRSISVNN